jgi:hypothetical protein
MICNKNIWLNLEKRTIYNVKQTTLSIHEKKNLTLLISGALLNPVTSSIIMMPRLYTSDLTDILPFSRYSGAVYPLHENILTVVEH